jgi:hypothetical protein
MCGCSRYDRAAVYYDGGDTIRAIRPDGVIDTGEAMLRRVAEAIERRAQELLAELAGIDPGDDTLGVVVRLALRDDPDATAHDVRAIWRDAAEEYAAERRGDSEADPADDSDAPA